MAVETDDQTPITSRDQLVAYMSEAPTPDKCWRIGTEHEKFLFDQATLKPVAHDGVHGVEVLLKGLAQQTGWQEVSQDGKIIGLHDEASGASVSLEPAGQFELSGGLQKTLHGMSDEVDAHIYAATKVAQPLGIGFLGLGFVPQGTREDMHVMPKRRYEIMMNYMPKVGTLGLDMMLRTSTVQVNLDFASEAQMIEMMRISLALQPIATALFASSPFTEGRLNGFKSFRSEIWRHTDQDRTGLLPFVFEKKMSFASYVDWALDVPLYFIKRGDVYHDVAGVPFRALLEGKVPGHENQRATLSDWTNHLGTLFPEVRLKHFLEMRGADSGPLPHIKALPAFWVGLLYDAEARSEALALIKDWTFQDIQNLRDAVPKLGLQSPFKSGSALDVARQALALSEKGLKNRGYKNSHGHNEAIYLEYLQEIVDTGQSLADRLIAQFHAHDGDVRFLYDAYAIHEQESLPPMTKSLCC